MCYIAAILAGGKSSRFGGVNKGLIEITPGVTILSRMINEMKSAGISRIVVLANEEKPYNDFELPVVKDLRTNIGPAAGIEAALEYASDYKAVLFLPCDLPAINSIDICRLLDFHRAKNCGVVYAQTPDNIAHPLCAVVNVSLHNQISEMLDAGIRKISDIWKQFGAEAVEMENSIRFTNLNTLDNLEEYRKLDLE